MAQQGGEISSLHLAVAAGGGVLLYAALRGVSPLQALKDVTSGAPPAVSTEGKVITGADGNADPNYTGGGSGSGSWKGAYRLAKVPAALRRPSAFIAALNAHAGEIYSEDQRWASGHSDCSSFAGKGLLDTGITPPGGSDTTAYLSSGDWVRVSAPRMGDIAVNSEHMAVFTDGSHGIGQQNPRRNVQRDTMDNLMANTGSWEIRRFKGWS
jgi:hypothetical protein